MAAVGRAEEPISWPCPAGSDSGGSVHRRRRRDLGGLRGRLRRPPLPGAGSMALRPVPPARPARACRPVPSAAACLRLLRIARLGVVAGVAHSRAQRSLHATVAVYVTTAAAGLLVLAAAAMYDVERRAPSGNIKTFPDELWWAITTVTTVGYGDRLSHHRHRPPGRRRADAGRYRPARRHHREHRGVVRGPPP